MLPHCAGNHSPKASGVTPPGHMVSLPQGEGYPQARAKSVRKHERKVFADGGRASRTENCSSLRLFPSLLREHRLLRRHLLGVERGVAVNQPALVLVGVLAVGGVREQEFQAVQLVDLA